MAMDTIAEPAWAWRAALDYQAYELLRQHCRRSGLEYLAEEVSRVMERLRYAPNAWEPPAGADDAIPF